MYLKTVLLLSNYYLSVSGLNSLNKICRKLLQAVSVSTTNSDLLLNLAIILMAIICLQLIFFQQLWNTPC